MKTARLLLFFLPLLLQSYSSQNVPVQKNNTEKWVSLFNGKDLSNWIPKIAGYPLGENFGNTFRVENGLLSTRYDAYDSFRSRFGSLYYNQKFTNFRLRVEYRFVGTTTPGAPSWGYKDGGIQYFCQPPETMSLNQPFPVCLEYNLLGSDGKNERGTGEICCSGMYVEINGKRNSSYCTQPFIKKAFDDNQWITAEIDVHDGKITQYVNGVAVIAFENPNYDSTNVLAKKFINGTNTLVKDGYISLQSNSHPMDFRKIEIMEY